MNAKEILEIIKQNMSVDAFGYGDYPIPSDFEIDDAIKDITVYNKDLVEGRLKSHPGYGDRNLRDDEWQRLYNESNNTPSLHQVRTQEWLKSLGLGEIEEVEQHGGEGEGSNWYSVKYFKDHNVYIKTTGCYSSYEGIEFYDGYGEEVKPVERTITVFESLT
jgi:hypothetical protein